MSHGSKSPRGKLQSGLVRILNRDLAAADIPEVDKYGRSIDVHVLQHTFATLLSNSGVAPRIAQAVMRHSNLRLITIADLSYIAARSLTKSSSTGKCTDSFQFWLMRKVFELAKYQSITEPANMASPSMDGRVYQKDF